MRLSIVLLLILSVGGAIATARLTGTPPSDNIGLVGGRSRALEPAIQLQAKAMGRRAHLHRLDSLIAASRAVRSGADDVALIDGSQLLVKTSPNATAVRVVQDAAAAKGLLDRLRRFGLTEAQALSAVNPVALPVKALEPTTHNTDRNRGLIVAGLLALYIALIFYGQAVAQGVTEEKSSRVVELLLTTVSPRCLLAGKVLGIGVLGLAQLLLAGGSALAAGQLAGGAGLPSAAPEAVALVLLWFVLGYILYSVAFAAVGALVSRQEDLQTAIVPLTVVMTGAFYLALIVSNGNPNGTLAEVTAFVPPVSPMVVPARMVLGDMNMLGLGVAIVLDLLATTVLVLLGARIYQRAILRIGAPVTLRRVLTIRVHQTREAVARPQRDRHVKVTNTEEADAGCARHRHVPSTDFALRAAAIASLLGAVAIGLSHPIGIALIVVGLLLITLLQCRKRRGPRHAGGR
jgi:ABC-2 type transport system permease protein